jgi:hypothetical protein
MRRTDASERHSKSTHKYTQQQTLHMAEKWQNDRET